MKFRIICAMCFTFSCLATYGAWNHFIQPEGMSTAVMQQLERKDEGAVTIRVAQSVQNYVGETVIIVWFLGLLCLFNDYVERGFSLIYGCMVPRKEE